MPQYLLRRVLQSVVLLFVVSFVLFAIAYSIGDPISVLTDGTRPPDGAQRDRIIRQLGLDKPTHIQYLYWLIGNDWTLVDADGDGDTDENIYGQRKGVLRGDLGQSIITRQPALDRINERLANTLLLMGTAYICVLVISLTVGVYAALRPYSALDNLLTTLAFIGYSMPIFFISMALIYIFAVQFRAWGLPYLPIAGMWDVSAPRDFGNLASHLVLPVVSLAIVQSAGYIRYVRAGVLDALNADYVRTARSKGLSEWRIVTVHVLKNAALPLVTLIGLDLPFLLGGAVVTESIFAWPGIGSLFIESLNRADYPVLMGILMMISVTVVMFQLLTDVTYAWFDPRVRLGNERGKS